MAMQRSLRASRSPKEERLEARMTPQQKELLQCAADLRGTSLTNFVLMSAKQAAEETIREHNIISLTARDSLVFAEALLNPRAPSAKLRAAFARHTEEVISVD